MTSSASDQADNKRGVQLAWEADGFIATNERGGQLAIGTGDSELFTPVELMLTALGGCAGLDMRAMLSRRQVPSEFTVTVSGFKTRDENGNYIRDIAVAFGIGLTDDAEGRVAREAVEPLMQRTHERICLVSKTLELPSSIEFSASVA